MGHKLLFLTLSLFPWGLTEDYVCAIETWQMTFLPPPPKKKKKNISAMLPIRLYVWAATVVLV